MIDDAELLRRYSEAASEDAFAEVVRRHIDFAYASALRRVGGDAHLAKDVTQHVFIALARQARTLARRESLSAWLFVTTRNLAAQVVRGERRRQVRESAAVLMTELHSNPTHDAEWEKLRPVLDGAMDGVSDQDRQAVLLRYYEGKSYADIGARFRLAENTARMRIDRALEKLRVELERRGVTSTTTGLGLAVANQAAVSAPAGLAATVTSTALASTAAGAAGWLGGLIGVGTIQATIAGAVAITGASIYVAQANRNSTLRQQIATMHEQRQALPALRAENRQLVAAAVELAALRRDDIEFQQLAVRVGELKKTREEKTRAARVRAQDLRRQLEEWIREQDRLAQAEVDRMNKEGSLLVIEFKRLSAEAKNLSLPADVRAQADAAAKAKHEEIQARQREVQAYIAESRLRLKEPLAELRRLEAILGPGEPAHVSAARESAELAARAAEIERRRAARTASPAMEPAAGSPQGTLIHRR
jgi:RNA polymerase sigma factor (sigma-70 family)